MRSPVFVRSPPLEALLSRFRRLLERAPKPPHILLQGPPGAGASTLLQQFVDIVNAAQPQQLAIYVLAPPVGQSQRLHHAVARELNIPIARHGQPPDRKRRPLKAVLEGLGTRIVAVDDAIHLADGRTRRDALALNQLEEFGAEFGVAILAGGLPNANDAAERLGDIASRFEITTLERWTNDSHFADLVRAQLRARRLELDTAAERDVLGQLHQLCDGTPGGLADVLSEISTRGTRRIDLDALARLDWRPTVRRWDTGPL